MNFDQRMALFNQEITNAKKIVFFTGAGISTGSGIPDFRSPDGLYSKPNDEKFDPEYLLSADCLEKHPEKFFDYLRKNMDFHDAEPNVAHLKIAELQLTREVSVATQNIDGLHERAKTSKVYTIHGTMERFYCDHCFHECPSREVMDGKYDNTVGVPVCPICGEGTIRPDVVLYGEGLKYPDWENASADVCNADLIVVVGSSLTVYPAAYLPTVGASWEKKIVIVNRDSTQLDGIATIVFHEDISEVFENIVIPN